MLSAPNRQKVRREQPKAQRSKDPPAERIGFAFRSGRQSNPKRLPAFGRFLIIDKSLPLAPRTGERSIHIETGSLLRDRAILSKSLSLDHG